MIFFQRKCHLLLILTLLLSLLTFSAGAESASGVDEMTGEQIVQRIEDTYEKALRSAGRYRFENRCSEMVNHSIHVLGIESRALHCDGSQEYDLYRDVDETSTFYRVVRYSARDYNLVEALYAVCEDGTKDVYNVAVGWNSGITANSSGYGHTCFIHAIVDGIVYYSESYGLYIAGSYYREGQPIICTIEEFADYYNKWAHFEGLIHFDSPDEQAPILSAVVANQLSDQGFRLNFRAGDNVGITELYANVWVYGQTEEEAVKLPAEWKNGYASVQVKTDDFGGFIGRYYIVCYAVDKRGNTATSNLVSGECVDLYSSQAAEGTYRVRTDVAGIHNAPYARVNGAGTLRYIMQEGTVFEIVGSAVNEDGQLWYQLQDGEWVNSAYVQRQIRWDEICYYIGLMLSELVASMG